jgi:hypothetical protein
MAERGIEVKCDVMKNMEVVFDSYTFSGQHTPKTSCKTSEAIIGKEKEVHSIEPTSMPQLSLEV